ncbi:alpha-N-arabinofuranosidase [Sphingomonas naasensis]|uniref:non-reducing end alpha-L-arabinofuranosidase n=1 Tax=Sphingomonas naasensis TaxID=1344951 RepID=A0A4S1WPX3_9SPHN|nr:alpha-N-arabinofuranosidase [Sphingomonas naasensis]NIJ20927.1 alpha-N-arabinofuranosidase [Sphingomonas naasensis]TGX43316.1 alpha-N-arabinofuranosidase [Sphingomonas naasensis]
MLTSRVIADPDFVVAPLDRRIFGTFVEHLGRCVYGGIYEPGHATADANGFRRDVLDLTRELGVTIVRYPGGNFVSGYDWEDGVGPREERPVRLDLAWGSTETNQFGTNEFIDWCRLAGLEPMFAVNLGTRGPAEAQNFIEYCNHPGGTHYSDLRRSHGYEAPHDIKFWCLGNEMDGPWQTCAKTAQEYGRVAKETAKVMRWTSDGLQLAVCGSSARDMPTYGAWEYTVLDHCFEDVDFISLHQYFTNHENDVARFLTAIDGLERFIVEVAAIADAVAARRRSTKRIMLSVDEWNVWYRARAGEQLRGVGWPEAPALLEEIYNFEDALIVGGVLLTMMNHADRVKSACIAQLVNVIGPIMTQTGGPAWRQTIFHPFAQAARYGRGNVLRATVDTGSFAAGDETEAPLLVQSVVHDPETGDVTVFALNRSLDSEMALTAELRGLGTRRLAEAFELHHADLKAINSVDAPDEVAPAQHPRADFTDGVLKAVLKPLSWNVFVTRSA